METESIIIAISISNQKRDLKIGKSLHVALREARPPTPVFLFIYSQLSQFFGVFCFTFVVSET